jgi:riboflavin biosynthesis pyrimidine reductase
MDRARGQVRVIIERYLKTPQTKPLLNESTPSGTNTLTEEEKRTERLKRDEMASDPERRKELIDLADRLAKEFGL